MPHGKICCIEIPAITGEASAAFYGSTVGWGSLIGAGVLLASEID